LFLFFPKNKRLIVPAEALAPGRRIVPLFFPRDNIIQASSLEDKQWLCRSRTGALYQKWRDNNK
jgi:hypothetical protein